MALRKPLVRILGRKSEIPSADRIEGAGIVWSNSTPTESSTLTEFISSGVPNQDGVVLFNLTTDGTAGGPAIFSQILNVNVSVEFAASDTAGLKRQITVYIHNISSNLKIAETRARDGSQSLANQGKIYIRVIGIA